MTELNDLTPEQMAAFKALMQRPDLVKLLMEFGENMSAARRFSKWIAWLAGIATAVAALVFYIVGIVRGHG